MIPPDASFRPDITDRVPFNRAVLDARRPSGGLADTIIPSVTLKAVSKLLVKAVAGR